MCVCICVCVCVCVHVCVCVCVCVGSDTNFCYTLKLHCKVEYCRWKIPFKSVADLEAIGIDNPQGTWDDFCRAKIPSIKDSCMHIAQTGQQFVMMFSQQFTFRHSMKVC